MRGSWLAIALWLALAAPALADGQLALESQPAGAAVSLDGWPMGRTPLVIHVEPGRHRLVTRMAGRTPRVQFVRVPSGLTVYRMIVLPSSHHPTRHSAQSLVRTEPPARAHLSKPKAPRPAKHRPIRVATSKARPQAHPVTPAFHAPAPRLHAPRTAWRWAWCLVAALLTAGLATLFKRRRRAPEPPVWFPARPARGVLEGPAPGDAEDTLRSWLASGEWALAAAGFWSLLAERRGTSWHYYHLGLALHHNGRAYEAETAYRTALQFDPTCAPAAFNLGVLLMEGGQPEQAVLAYRKLLDAYPLSVDGWFNLGHVYYQLHMTERAREAWLEGRAIAPWDPAIRQNLKHLPPVFGKRRRTTTATGSDPACA